MAFNRIGIATAAQRGNPASWQFGLRVKGGTGTGGSGGDDPGTLYLMLKSDKPYSAGIHGSVKLAVTVEGIPKGSPFGGSAYGPKAARTVTVAASAAIYDAASGLWAVPLLDAIGSGWSGGTWRFQDRTYDQIHIMVSAKMTYVSGVTDEFGRTESEATDAEAYIGYIPTYVLDGIEYFGSGTMAISYHAPGWTRTDDRWELMGIVSGGRQLLDGKAWGDSSEVGEPGKLPFNVRRLASAPDTGDDVAVTVRFNAQYRPAGLEFATASATLEVGGNPGTYTGGSSSYEYTDDGRVIPSTDGTTYEAVYYTIKGEGWEFDAATAPVSQSSAQALLNFPPLNVEFTVQVLEGAFSPSDPSVWYQSGKDEFTARVPVGNKVLIDVLDRTTGGRVGEQVVLIGDPELTVSTSRERDVLRLSGRTSPSAVYGAGIDRTIELRGRIIPGLGSQPQAWYALEGAGDVVLRAPDGRRWVASVDSVQITHSHASRLDTVAVSFTEVGL